MQHDAVSKLKQRHVSTWKYQSRFRANFSTDSCLAQQTDVALTDMDKGIHTGTILIDLITDEQHKLITYFNLLEITSCCGNREMV